MKVILFSNADICVKNRQRGYWFPNIKMGVVNASLAMQHALMQQEAVLDFLLHV